MKTMVVTPHFNCLGETILLMGHNILFKGVLWEIIFELSLLPLLIWSVVDLEFLQYIYPFLSTLNPALQRGSEVDVIVMQLQ